MMKFITVINYLIAIALLVTTFGCDSDVTEGDNANLVAKPNPISFGIVNLGDTTSEVLLLSNSGTSNLRIYEINVSGSNEFQLDLTQNPLPIDIESETNVSIPLNYSPIDTGIDSGSVFIRSNSVNSKELTIPITTLGVQPEIEVIPNPVQFGRVGANNQEVRNLRVLNVGQAPLEIQDLTITGSSDFSIEILTEDGNVPSQLLPESDFEVAITYAPPTEGPDTGEIIIFSSDKDESELRVPITANSSAPCILVAPGQIDFAEAFIGGINTRAITITNCGLETLIIDSVVLDEASSTNFIISDLPSELPDGPAEIAGEDSATFTVNFAPAEEIAESGNILISSNDTATPIVEVPLFGRGTFNDSPWAVIRGEIEGSIPPITYTNDGNDVTSIEADPLATILLDGNLSSDPNDTISSWSWELRERPDGSSENVVPAGSGATAELFLDLAGEYQVCLTVYDSRATPSENDACITILVIPGATIHIQLVWDTDGSDVDLHFLHQLANLNWVISEMSLNYQYDCFYANKNPSWGPEEGNNPTLDIDDIDGFGPENINLEGPEPSHEYHVGVFYYSDHSTGATNATTRIYINHQLELEADKRIQNRDLWFVATIIWNMNGTFFIQTVDQVTSN